MDSCSPSLDDSGCSSCGKSLAAWSLACRYPGTDFDVQQLVIVGFGNAFTSTLAMVYALAAGRCNRKCQSSNYSARYATRNGRYVGVLLLALAACMDEPGTINNRVASDSMGMGAILYFDLVYDASKRYGATTSKIDKGLELFASLMAFAPFLACTAKVVVSLEALHYVLLHKEVKARSIPGVT